MDSSSKNEPIITFQVVKQHAVKEISIPRHKPVTVIRKAVHITDSGSKEKAIMGSLIATLNLLGIFLYWWEDAGCFPFLNIVWKHKQCGEMEAIHWDTMVIWRLMNLWKKKIIRTWYIFKIEFHLLHLQNTNGVFSFSWYQMRLFIQFFWGKQCLAPSMWVKARQICS